MAEIIRKSISMYKLVFDELTDPNTKSWLFVAKPYEGLTILALYLMFVLKWGPNYMKDRKPMNLDKILIVYNALQVISCAYIFVVGMMIAWGWGQRYRWVCEPVDYSGSEHALQVRRVVYFYYLLKIADLADTIFFVLRKKFNQLTFLHIYHHTGMVMMIWAATTYYPGGHGTLVGLINALVHCVMYSYYLLTVAFPAVKQNMAFKKFVTQIQIVQFFLCTVHFSIICFKPDCAYPRWTAAVFLPQNVFMLVLFLDFYIRTYVKKPNQKLGNKKTDLEDTNKIQMTEVDKAIQKTPSINTEVKRSLRHKVNSNSKNENRS